MAVEASIILEFGEGVDEDSAGIVIEVDDQYSENMDWEGNLKSTFSPEDDPMIIIHHSPKVYIKDVLSTDGIMGQHFPSSLLRKRTTECLFTKYSEENSKVSTGYNSASSLSMEWKGKNTCDVAIDSGDIVPTSLTTYPCVGEATFYVEFNEQWQLIAPSMNLGEDETYTIYIVVYVEKVI